MKGTRGSRAAVLASVALAALAGAGLWLLLSMPEEAAPSAEARCSGGRAADARAPAVSGEVLELARGDARARERVPVAASADAAGESDAAGPADRRHLLQVELRPSPWVDTAEAEAILQWTRSDGQVRRARTRLGAGSRLELDGAPPSMGEFGEVRVADLVARVVALTEMEQGGEATGPRVFELELAVESGATALWDEAVPRDRRVPLTLALGGSLPPPSREILHVGRRRGRTSRVGPLELPVQLPRVARSDSLWVGGPGLAWSALGVEPDAERVEVWAPQGVTIDIVHDFRSAADDLHAWVSESTSGDTQRAAVGQRSEVALGPMTAGTLEVWISRGAGRHDPRVTRTAMLEANPGEHVTVDLTERHALESLGSLRLELRGVSEATGFSRGGVSVQIVERAPGDAAYGWVRAGEFQERSGASNGGWVYEVDGLEPGEYRVVVSPIALRLTVEIVAGDRLERVVSVDDVGWIEPAFPAGYGQRRPLLVLTSVEPDARDRSAWHLGEGRSRRGATMWPVVPGRYTAELLSFGAGESAITSEPFDVVGGQVSRVPIIERERWDLHVVVTDTGTGERIALERAFWGGLGLFAAETGASLLASCTLRGATGVHAGCRLALEPADGPVRLQLPEHPRWAFEEPGPLLLHDGLTVEVAARPRGR